MLLNSLQDDEYEADYGVLVVYDLWGDDADSREPDLGPGLDPELLELTEARVQPGGTVAHAGAGWLWARASGQDTYHVARLEAHDGPPADDHGDWDEVLETPYWSRTGAVQLGLLTGGPVPDGPALPIGRPGRYRVRVSGVRDHSSPGSDEGDVWRLQFWPAPDDHEPPRWLARTEPLTVDAVAENEDEDQEADGQFAELATDLVYVARWTPAGTACSVADLAARVLALPDEVRGGLAAAVRERHLAVDGDLSADQAPVILTPLPDGPPLATGIVTSNRELVVWRAGAPEVLARVERGARRALATPYGIVVTGPKLAVLVRPDGEQLKLAPDPGWRVALSADGRHTAIASAKYGRQPRFGLYLADLADRSAQSLDLPEPVEVQGLVHGAVRFCLESGDADPTGLAWTPGSAPVPAPYLEGETDRLSGACLTVTEAGTFRVTRRDGAELIVEHPHGPDEWVHLSPGGRWLYHFSRYPGPAALTVTDVSGPAPEPRVTWPLPDGSTGAVFCEYPSEWEDDNTHVLLPAPGGPGFHAARVDAATGAAERPRLDRQGRGKPGQDGDGAEFDVDVFVEPFRPGPDRALPTEAGGSLGAYCAGLSLGAGIIH
jgi:hypothetical protein